MPLADPAARVESFDGEAHSTNSPTGNESLSFLALYQRYFSFVWSCTRRMGVREHELDDAVQDVFIVIHGRLSTLEKPESLRSWIYGIIRRTASAYHRARRAKVTSAEAYQVEPQMQYPQQPSPLELAEQTDQVRLLWSLLEKLDPPKREVLVLAELDEMTAPEIATVLEVPLNTVYSRLRTARQELEATMARHHAQTGQRGRS
jgi:RNA polymerase sigma-70 factor (ECF subfamily)